MSIAKAIRERARVAVFTRNYQRHLDQAFRVSNAEPDRLIPFRSVLRWSSAAELLREYSPLDIYFAAVDSGPLVLYTAKLQRVILDPQRNQPETEQLLDQSTSTTQAEGLWETEDKSARTLYGINQFNRIPQPFLMTELIKVSDDQPISPAYAYSYALVYAR